MKDPIRLLEGDGTDAEQVLLRAAVGEEPPADGARRLATALGVAVGGAGAGASAGASEGPGAGASAGLGASKLVLWVVLGSLGLAAVSAVWVMRGRERGVEGVRPQDNKAVDAAERVEVPPAGQAAAPQPAVEPARAAGSIAREIEQIDAARGRLQRGDARGALAQLDVYGREHAAGALRQEATLLKIEALVQVGERAAARELAARFLREHPDSPHAARVRALASPTPDAR